MGPVYIQSTEYSYPPFPAQFHGELKRELRGWKWHYRLLNTLPWPIILTPLLVVNRMSVLHVEPRVFSSSAGLTDSCRVLAYQSTDMHRHVTTCMCWPCKVMCWVTTKKYVVFCFSIWISVIPRGVVYVLLIFVPFSNFLLSNIHCAIDRELDWACLDSWHVPISLCPWWNFCLCPTGRLAGCDYRDRSAKKEREGEEEKEVYVKTRFTPVHLHCYWKRTRSTHCVG